MKKILLIGGGGHCRVVIDTLRQQGGYDLVGIVDAARPLGERLDGVPVIGTDADLGLLRREGVEHAFVAVGSLGDTAIRVRIAAQLQELGFLCPIVQHPTAVVASTAQLAPGVLVAAHVVVQPGVDVGVHAILNTASSIDHDCRLGAFVHVAPGVVLSGQVQVGDHTHIGTGSCVKELMRIGGHSVVGAGSVVVADLPERCVAYGHPCAVQRRIPQ